MPATARTTGLCIVPPPGRTLVTEINAIRLHYRKLFSFELSRQEAVVAAVRTYLAAVEHAHLGRSIGLMHATLWNWSETRLGDKLFHAPDPSPAAPSGAPPETLEIEMDADLHARVEAAMHLGGFDDEHVFLHSAAEFHLRLLTFYEDCGWWGTSWLRVGGCWRRRWYWPFGRPKGTDATDPAGRRLKLVLLECLE